MPFETIFSRLCKLNCYALSRNSKIIFQYMFRDYLYVSLSQTRIKCNYAPNKE